MRQRKAEENLISSLGTGATTLYAMVTNMTSSFKAVEALRQQKGFDLISEHFINDQKFLEKAQVSDPPPSSS